MNKLYTAYEYVSACRTQEIYEQNLAKALQMLCPDNYVMSLSDTLRKSYREVVEELLGTEAMDWIEYWQYECDYGKDSMSFQIDNKEYDTSTLTLYQYLEITCGLKA